MATFASSPTVLHGYLAMDAVWEKGTFSPVERNIVLLAASVANDCGYCTAAHSTVLKGFLKVPAETVAKSPVAVFSELMNLLIKYYLSSVYAKRISIIT
jgi:AhpD family alkylhydroperoxidase